MLGVLGYGCLESVKVKICKYKCYRNITFYEIPYPIISMLKMGHDFDKMHDMSFMVALVALVGVHNFYLGVSKFKCNKISS